MAIRARTEDAVKTVSATEMKNRFGRYLEASVAEPIVVEKAGRPIAVLLSFEDYEHFERLEDAYWSARADAAMAEGLAGPEEAQCILDRYYELEHSAEA
jgi:antitoxin Phd